MERGAKCRQKKEHAKVTSAFKIKKEKVETYEENVLKATRKKTSEGKRKKLRQMCEDESDSDVQEEVDEVDAPTKSFQLARIPGVSNVPITLKMFQNYQDPDEQDSEDDEPSSERIDFKQFFYNFNTKVYTQTGRAQFMRMYGIKSMSQTTVEVISSVPMLDQGWIKDAEKGSSFHTTDPFAEWYYRFSPLQQFLSVLRFMSDFNVEDNCVPVRELMGIEILLENGIDWQTQSNFQVFEGNDAEVAPGHNKIQTRNVVGNANKKMYFCTQPPNQDELYTLTDKYLNPTTYNENPADFENNVMRLNDHVLWNAFKEAEPSNTSYTYDDAPTEIDSLNMPGIRKVLDYQFKQPFNIIVNYGEYSDPTRPWFPSTGTSDEGGRKDTASLQQGASISVDMTEGMGSIGMMLWQNILLMLSSVVIQPGLWPLGANGKMRGSEPNYQNLYNDWWTMIQAISEPRYIIKLIFSNNSVPNDAYQYLTGQIAGQQVQYQNAVDDASTFFGVLGPGNPEVVSHCIKSNELKTSKFDTSLYSEWKKGRMDIKHAHVMRIPFKIKASQQYVPNHVPMHILPTHVQQGKILCDQIHSAKIAACRSDMYSKQDRIKFAKDALKWLTATKRITHDCTDLMTHNHIMCPDEYKKEITKVRLLKSKRQEQQRCLEEKEFVTRNRKELMEYIKMVENLDSMKL